MAKSKKLLHEEIRNRFLNDVIKHFQDGGEDVLLVKSNCIAIPTLDEEGNDEWVTLTITVPTGSRDDGEAYDGYGMAQQYHEKCEEARAKKAKAEADKKAKIERDKAQREARAKAKAEHEKGK